MKKDKTILKFNIIAIISIIIFCIAIAPITLQNDTYYTISVGKHILQNGIDKLDAFSWHDLSYTYPHWGYDVFIYSIYANFGMIGIYISTCILSAILGLSIYGVNCKLAKNHIVSFILTLAAIYCLKDYIAARAQLVTFILFILTIFFIEQFLETKKKRYIIGLIIIPIIIANCHVAVWPFYFVLYLPYIGEYLIAVLTDIVMNRKLKIKRIERKIERLSKVSGNEEQIAQLRLKLSELIIRIEKAKKRREEAKANPYKLKIEKKQNTKWLIIIVLVCILTGLLTPIGDAPYTYLIKTMQGETTQNINEHQPMTLIKDENIMCLLVLYLAILTFTDTKIQLRDLFMISGLTFLMLYSKRQSAIFIVVGSVVLNRLVFQAIERYINKLNIDYKLMKAIATKIGALVILMLVLSMSLNLINKKKNDKFVNPATYPVEACDYILKNIDITKAKFYNDYNYGSYMLFRGIPVFIDSRADLYSPEFNTKTGNPKDGKNIFMDYINVSNIATYYEPLFDDYGITHVITTKKSKLAMLINNRNDNKYEQMYSDGAFVIYEIKDEDSNVEE